MKISKIPADYYERSLRTNILQRFYHLTRFSKILETIGEFEGDFLDVGCASGLLTAKISNKIKGQGWGIDINPDFINYAKKNYPSLNFLVTPAESLPFTQKKFNLVVCSEVLEHVANPQNVLRECRKVLKDDGRILVIVPSESLLFRSLWFFWTRMKGKVWQHTHLHRFKKMELKEYFKKAGFRILRQDNFQLGMLVLIMAEKV